MGTFFLPNKASERAQWDTQSRCLILKGQCTCLGRELSDICLCVLSRATSFIGWNNPSCTQCRFVAAIIKTVTRTYFKNEYAKLLTLCKHGGLVSCPSSCRLQPRKSAHGEHFVRAAESMVGNEIWSGCVLSAAARCVLFGAVRLCDLSVWRLFWRRSTASGLKLAAAAVVLFLVPPVVSLIFLNELHEEEWTVFRVWLNKI